jgi:hypothetical protein
MPKVLLILFLFLLPLSPAPATTYSRILFVGNSLTVHYPNPALDWPYLHGMAASQTDRDYVHQVQLKLAALQGTTPEIAIVSADINRWDRVTGRTVTGGLASEFGADLVVVQMGDNSTPEVPIEQWEEAYKTIRTWSPNARFIALGVWAPNVGWKEENVRRAALAAGMEFVSIRDLHIFGVTDARQHTAPGVGWHPNDLGMDLISQRSVEALAPKTYLPGILNGDPPGTIPGTIPPN